MYANMKLRVILLVVGAANATISGVNTGGWLLIEEWMFSNGLFDGVAESDDTPQGVVMPPKVPEGFGEFWYSEGDLVNKLVAKYGASEAIDIIEAHRSTYITDEDMAMMAENGIEQVRVPVGWWAFAEESVGANTSVIIEDPVYADRKFVTLPTAHLERVIAAFAAHGLSVLLDIHAFPGGSASGSYNGIFPSTPVFFANASLQALGVHCVGAPAVIGLLLPRGTEAIPAAPDGAELWLTLVGSSDGVLVGRGDGALVGSMQNVPIALPVVTFHSEKPLERAWTCVGTSPHSWFA